MFVFGSLSADCIQTTFSHIIFANEGVSLFLRQYPLTPFPYVRKSNIDNDVVEVRADLQFGELDCNVNIFP